MQSVVSPPAAPTMSEGAAAWSQLVARLNERNRLDAEIVALAGRVQRSGTIEAIEGLTFDATLSRTHRLTRADRSMLLTAADVLPDMPHTMCLFEAGRLSFSQVRGIVADAKRLSRELRGVLDAHIDASQDMFAKWDPDDAVDAVRIVVEELRDARATERSEDAQARGSFVWAQLGMFDRAKLYGEADNATMAAWITGMDAAAPADDGRTQAQRRADGLTALATHRCDTDPTTGEIATEPDGDDEPTDRTAARRRTRHPLLGRQAKPAFVCLVDTRDVSVNAAGMLQVNVPGCLPTISAALVEALAADATVQAVLMDGGRPLTVTKKVRAKQLPDDVRLAVKARDRADRFPGSRRPIDHVHHFDKRGEGHHLDFLAGLSNQSHKRVHRKQWSITLDPASGEMTFTRGDRTWTTLPRGTRLRRPPPPGDPPPT